MHKVPPTWRSSPVQEVKSVYVRFKLKLKVYIQLYYSDKNKKNYNFFKLKTTV